MSSLFRSGGTVNAPTPPAAGLRIQQSVQGKPRPLVWGMTRIAGNLLWYGDFRAVAVQQSSASGKGTGAGSSGKGSQGSSTYSYTASVMIGLCEGPITGINNVWNNKSKHSFASTGPIAGLPYPFNIFIAASGALGLVLLSGSYAQGAWGYLTSLHPGQDLNYRGDAVVAAGPMGLGNNPELPNLNFEVIGAINSAYAGTTDANPVDVVTDFLTNTQYGLGWPAGRVDAMASYRNYCNALGLVFSPALVEQSPARDILKGWMEATNSDFVWSSGTLKVVPYGDQAAGSYAPPTQPLYALGDVDFKPGRSNSSSSAAPVDCARTRIEDMNNSIKVEYLDATNDYNPVIVEAKDDGAIFAWGLKAKAVSQHHAFTQAGAAQMSASLQLGREWIRNLYTFTIGAEYILLDPMDIVSITDSGLGLSNQWVRIREITENDNFTLTIVAEEYLAGTASAPLYGSQPSQGFLPNYNAAPGVVAPPLIFEPTDQLAGGLFVWGAVTGVNLATWGGCEVYASWDNATYARVGEMLGPSRMGALSAPLPAFVLPAQGVYIDTADTLSVDLSASHGTLASDTHADNIVYGSLLYVDGEYISYEGAAATGTYAFNLTTLNRAGYGTASNLHAAGARVCRVDQGLFRIAFTADKIGQTLYLKFLSFNPYGGGQQGLGDVGPYSYVIQGTALTSPLPNVNNFVSSYVGNITYLDWDPVSDFRPLQYEIRKGATWPGAQYVGTYAHPHVPAIGDGLYWVAAVSQPVPGLKVYSAQPINWNVVGSVLSINLLASYDEGPTGANWPGTLTGGVTISGPFIDTIQAVSTYSDFLAVPDVYTLTDKFGVGASGSGYYTIPDSHIVNAGRLAPLLVQIIFAGAGQGSSDFFHPGPPDDNDVFAHTDIFDTAANQFIDVHPEIAISTDGVNFGPWQRYQAGFYNAWKVKARMYVASFDPINVSAVLTQFAFIVFAQTRTDHPLVSAVVPAAGQTLTFAPDGAAAAAFNGGPNGGTVSGGPGITLPAASLPGTQAEVMNTAANAKINGDDVFISSLTRSSCFLQVMNGGVGVQRNVTLQVWGF